ncbi:protein of unknown function [Nakamurella panacisegetis]|uniref:Rv2525c-like glycoside hydrolase-like domain-containing protein n=1 Tax=Nakamurella panacisegetis TaxID=1090615 RepID=A0A1H0KGI8_9ACTN|nr:glycoside hydrolase domain-containing protein [Nakamurella panacisegetis]SDO55015.1 protein of unknown function [Nakamurella panacisegetis]
MRFSSFLRSSTLRAAVAVTMGAAVLTAIPAAASAAPPVTPTTPSTAPTGTDQLSSPRAQAQAAAAASTVLNPAAVTAPAGTRSIVTPGLKGLDQIGVVNATQMSCLSGKGYSFAFVNTNETTFATYNNAAAAGLKVVLFQGYYQQYWANQGGNGTTQGQKAATYATTAKYPAGGMIFLNLEQTTNTTHSNLMTWVKAWAAAVIAKGFKAGVYIGANAGLTKADLDTMPGVSAYWRSTSHDTTAPTPTRGLVVIQSLPLDDTGDGCGIGVDQDTAGRDANGVQLVGAAFPRTRTAASAAGAFEPLSPTRLLDTRSGLGAKAGAVPSTGRLTLTVAGRGGVPSTGVSAVVLNVTATAPTTAGNISVAPAGGTNSGSNVNYAKGQTAANLVTVGLGTGGAVTLANGGSGSVQMIADVAGYYLAGAGPASAPGTFQPLTSPVRLLDTRPKPAAAHSTTVVQVTGVKSTIPNDGSAGAAVMNLTAVAPSQPGYLTAFATGTSAPNASSVNYVVGATTPNLATVRLSVANQPSGQAGGQISLYNNTPGATNLLADVTGYYLAGQPTLTGTYQAMNSPVRLLDTRSGKGGSSTVAASRAIALQVAGTGSGATSIPSTATAVAINVTVVGPAAGGYLRVFPSDQSAPNASNLDFAARATVANLVIVPIGADGKIVLDNQSGGTTDVLGDVAGYFLG